MMNLRKSTKLINLYPPYLGSGISIKEINENYTSITVQMKMHFWNRNLVGTHFGGSLYSMCDPFYMFILMEHLGKGYIVWDKAASIEFKKPGLKAVYATFTISEAEIQQIKEKVDIEGKGNFTFYTEVVNDAKEIIAKVEKVVYVRKK